MARKANWKMWVTLGVATAVMITSGTLVIASNMGFKINKQIFNGFISTASPKRLNWVSLPYNNPYPNAKSLCNALGASVSNVLIYQLNPTTGGFSVNFPCSLPTTAVLDPTKGVRITDTRPTASGGLTNGILVGSSNETQALPTILGGFIASQAPKKDNWISVPYHTTWVKAEDVCVTLGLGSVAPNGPGSIIRINADPAVGANTVSHPCGNSIINNFNLVIGEAIDVRKTNAGDLSGILPPHF